MAYPPSRMLPERHSERERSNQRFQNVTLLELLVAVNTNDKRSNTILTDNLDVFLPYRMSNPSALIWHSSCRSIRLGGGRNPHSQQSSQPSSYQDQTGTDLEASFTITVMTRQNLDFMTSVAFYIKRNFSKFALIAFNARKSCQPFSHHHYTYSNTRQDIVN